MTAAVFLLGKQIAWDTIHSDKRPMCNRILVYLRSAKIFI